jgi:hypothetical protein
LANAGTTAATAGLESKKLAQTHRREVAMFLRHELDDLLACEAEPAVSLYLPTHTAGREVRQDAIRLRNLLSQAADCLGAGRRGKEIDELLEPASRLVDDEEFWRYQEHGLAVFLAPAFARIHKLPIAVPEQLRIGQQFSIRPLLPLIDTDAWFWLLAITARRTRLFQASRWTIAEVSHLKLPQGVSELRGESVYEEAHYAAPTGRPSRAPSGLAKAQSFGDSPDELHKTQLIELLRRIAAAVEPAINRERAPVVLAAGPEIDGNFRDIARWKELLPETVACNPDAAAPEELRQRAWALVEPREAERRAAALGQLASLLGTGNPKAATKPEEIVKAARYGRVERLFLCDGALLWGRFDEGAERLVAHGEPVAGDSDLFDYAALMTLRQGGAISLVERADLPPDGPAAAILRY